MWKRTKIIFSFIAVLLILNAFAVKFYGKGLQILSTIVFYGPLGLLNKLPFDVVNKGYTPEPNTLGYILIFLIDVVAILLLSFVLAFVFRKRKKKKA